MVGTLSVENDLRHALSNEIATGMTGQKAMEPFDAASNDVSTWEVSVAPLGALVSGPTTCRVPSFSLWPLLVVVPASGAPLPSPCKYAASAPIVGCSSSRREMRHPGARGW